MLGHRMNHGQCSWWEESCRVSASDRRGLQPRAWPSMAELWDPTTKGVCSSWEWAEGQLPSKWDNYLSPCINTFPGTS